MEVTEDLRCSTYAAIILSGTFVSSIILLVLLMFIVFSSHFKHVDNLLELVKFVAT